MNQSEPVVVKDYQVCGVGRIIAFEWPNDHRSAHLRGLFSLAISTRDQPTKEPQLYKTKAALLRAVSGVVLAYIDAGKTVEVTK